MAQELFFMPLKELCWQLISDSKCNQTKKIPLGGLQTFPILHIWVDIIYSETNHLIVLHFVNLLNDPLCITHN